MNKNLNPKQVLIIFAVVLVFLLTVAALAYNRLVSLVETNELINRNNQFVLKLEEVFSSLKDAETGARGYLLTSDTLFLRPQRTAGKKVALQLLQLRSDIKNIDEQIPYIDSIQRLSQKNIDIVWRLVHSIRPGEIKPFTDNQKSLVFEGKTLMDSLRLTIQHLKSAEQKRLDINMDAQRKFATDSPRFLLIIIISAISVIILTMWGIYRQLKLLNNAKEKLEEKINELAFANRELDQYAFTLTHHLQEPLRKIRLFSSRLENQFKKALGTEGGKSLESIGKINVFAADAQRLLDEFLAFTHLNQKNTDPEEVIDLQDVIKNIWSEKTEWITATQAQYEYHGETHIVGYKKHFGLLLEQLIDNALKFKHLDRTPLIVISHTEEMIEGKAFSLLTVKDNGIGFEQEYAQKIFLLFQKLNPKAETVGLGVGLAICSKIVERHKGTISAESEPNEGTIFTIKIPLKA